VVAITVKLDRAALRVLRLASMGLSLIYWLVN
jgi:hypothetical protein